MMIATQFRLASLSSCTKTQDMCCSAGYLSIVGVIVIHLGSRRRLGKLKISFVRMCMCSNEKMDRFEHHRARWDFCSSASKCPDLA